MEGRATWPETFFFSIVDTFDVTHVLSHGVSVVIRWSEGSFLNQPSWWEDNEVTQSSSMQVSVFALRGKEFGYRLIEWKLAYPGSSVGAVKTVKILGSG